MTVKERLARLIEALPEEEAARWVERIEAEAQGESEEDTPDFLALALDIADNAPADDLARIPSDGSKNVDAYLYGAKRA
jgi:hypothetical protein